MFKLNLEGLFEIAVTIDAMSIIRDESENNNEKELWQKLMEECFSSMGYCEIVLNGSQRTVLEDALIRWKIEMLNYDEWRDKTKHQQAIKKVIDKIEM